MRSSLYNLCDRWEILVAPPAKPAKKQETARTVDFELEEIDTGSPDRYIYISIDMIMLWYPVPYAVVIYFTT